MKPAEPRHLGLRERKKLRTRAAIQAQALRLFRDQGYDATTVAEIAEAADVSSTTFFRYFPTKEAVVVYDAVDPYLIEAFRAQPADLSPLAALRNATHAIFGALSADELAGELERARLVIAVPALRAAMLDDVLRTSRVFAELLAERVG
jgi:AcrR family transcriptional regulator